LDGFFRKAVQKVLMPWMAELSFADNQDYNPLYQGGNSGVSGSEIGVGFIEQLKDLKKIFRVHKEH